MKLPFMKRPAPKPPEAPIAAEPPPPLAPPPAPAPQLIAPLPGVAYEYAFVGLTASETRTKFAELGRAGFLFLQVMTQVDAAVFVKAVTPEPQPKDKNQ